MKKSKKEMIISFKSLNTLENEVLSSIKMKIPRIQTEDIIYFDTWTSFRGFMTLQKIEILTLISSAAPHSIYELTHLLDRNLAAVQNDCEALEQAGFITLEKKKTGRGQVIPRLKFNYDKIIVLAPEHPYELSFKSVA